MLWIDYNLESFPDGSFTVKGDWPGEVMGLKQDGSLRNHWLYRPGDVFIVDDNGILRKQEDLTSLLIKYKANKNEC